MKTTRIFAALTALTLIAQPAFAKSSLNSKERARVARAAPSVRQELRYCLIERKKGGNKGTLIGALGGAGVGAVAGGNLGETALAAGAGALAGNALGHGTSTNKRCDYLLKRYK